MLKKYEIKDEKGLPQLFTYKDGDFYDVLTERVKNELNPHGKSATK